LYLVLSTKCSIWLDRKDRKHLQTFNCFLATQTFRTRQWIPISNILKLNYTLPKVVVVRSSSWNLVLLKLQSVNLSRHFDGEGRNTRKVHTWKRYRGRKYNIDLECILVLPYQNTWTLTLEWTYMLPCWTYTLKFQQRKRNMPGLQFQRWNGLRN
jgi:hypothetical protein